MILLRHERVDPTLVVLWRADETAGDLRVMPEHVHAAAELVSDPSQIVEHGSALARVVLAKHAVGAHDVEVFCLPHRAEALEVVPRLQKELRLVQAVCAGQRGWEVQRRGVGSVVPVQAVGLPATIAG